MLDTVFDLVAIPPHGDTYWLATYRTYDEAFGAAREMNHLDPYVYHDVRKRLIPFMEESYVAAGPVPKAERENTNWPRCHH